MEENDGESAGVIAQDVVLPEVVKTVNNPDGNTYKAVNYAGINSILIEAIKELSARIKVLEVSNANSKLRSSLIRCYSHKFGSQSPINFLNITERMHLAQEKYKQLLVYGTAFTALST